jgi:hypothetical protein
MATFASTLLAVCAAGLATSGVEPLSAERFRQHVAYLASDELAGRDVGSPGAVKAAEYVARHFKEFGLEPVGESQTYFQPFSWNGKPARNVVGLLAGAGELSGEFVLVSAHYDHLGILATEGKPAGDIIYNGADDNASGVAVLLQMAQAIAHDKDQLAANRRSILFVAFDAEERGLFGARHYVQVPARPLEKTVAVLNFDQVGRLRQKVLNATEASSCAYFEQTLAALAKEFGLRIETRGGGAMRSDQAVFLERRIPAIQFQTGMHANYHQVSDEVATLNLEGAALVARVADRFLRNIITHNGPLPFRPLDPDYDVQHLLGIVSRLGIVPELNSQDGKYPKVLFVIPNSPAAQHGLKGGDQITGFDGKNFERLEDAMILFAQLRFDRDLRLALLREGQQVEITIPAEVFKAMAGPESTLTRGGSYEVAFRFKPPKGARSVSVAGSFNEWNPSTLAMDGPDNDGFYSATLVLKPGDYEYKFVIDNGKVWQADPSNMHQVGPYRNSLLRLGSKRP